MKFLQIIFASCALNSHQMVEAGSAYPIQSPTTYTKQVIEKPQNSLVGGDTLPDRPTPAIVVRGTEILVNGVRVKMGGSMESWKRALPPRPRCLAESRTVCLWDEFGIKIGSILNDPTRVDSIKLFFNVDLPFPWYSHDLDTQRITSPYIPQRSFSGYLELDGFSIDVTTRFRDLQQSVDPWRNFSCDYRSCGFPHGRFTRDDNLYLRLRGPKESDTIVEFAID